MLSKENALSYVIVEQVIGLLEIWKKGDLSIEQCADLIINIVDQIKKKDPSLLWDGLIE